MKHADGYLYIGVAVCTALATSFSSEDAAKFISPQTLWWLRTGFGSLGAGLFAAKMYRSTAFATQQALDKSDTKTETVTHTVQTSDIPPAQPISGPVNPDKA